MRDRFDRILGSAVAGLGFGLVAILVLTVALLSSRELRAHLGLSGVYSVGQRIDTPDIYSGSRLTILLFTRSNCRGCQAAKPWLRTIADWASSSVDIRVAVVPVRQLSAAELAYVRELGLDERSVHVLPVSDLKVRVVPTIIVVDQRGRIQFVREGLPTSQDQATLQDLASRLVR